MANFTVPLPTDSNSVPFAGLYDPAGHRFVAPQSGTVTSDSGNLYGPTVVSSADGALATLGAIGDSAWPGSGTGSAIAVLKELALLILNGTGKIVTYGSSDGGTTLTYLRTATDGTLSVNANLGTGSALAGGMMTYHEMLTRGYVGVFKLLKASANLTNSGGATVTINSWTDQQGATYTTVTTGKTLYVSAIDASCDTNSSGTFQSTDVAITDGSVTKYQFVATSSSNTRLVPVPFALASASTLTLTASPSNLATAAGKIWVTLVAWEE